MIRDLKIHRSCQPVGTNMGTCFPRFYIKRGQCLPIKCSIWMITLPSLVVSSRKQAIYLYLRLSVRVTGFSYPYVYSKTVLNTLHPAVTSMFEEKLLCPYRYDEGKRLWRVVHSMHASMEEVYMRFCTCLFFFSVLRFIRTNKHEPTRANKCFCIMQ